MKSNCSCKECINRDFSSNLKAVKTQVEIERRYRANREKVSFKVLFYFREERLVQKDFISKRKHLPLK